MGNPFTLIIKLKQHTPLIHFQHEQDGATLRATEVKPKLDRFIIRHHGTVKALRAVQPVWFASYNHNSLDYKLSITPLRPLKEYAISSSPDSREKYEERAEKLMQYISAEYLNKTQYFGDNQYIDNIDDYHEIRKGVLYEGLTVKISSFNAGLVENIRNLFPAFIVSENFGTRQTKGFGCFSVQGTTDEQIVESLKTNPIVTGIFKVSRLGSFEDKLQFTASHYSQLKRGSTYHVYQKSKLWDYLCLAGGKKWEKRKIKLFIREHDEQLFNRLKYDARNHQSHLIDDCNHSEVEEYFYVRALLGLAEQYEFMLIKPTAKLRVFVDDRLRHDNSTKQYAVERFRSPIRYFITDRSIFLVTERINPLLHTYLDDSGTPHPRKFQFTIDSIEGENNFSLPVPTNFNLPDFIVKKGNFGKNLK